MKTNVKNANAPRTHEGAISVAQSPVNELKRTVMACMLFEDSFYESGEDSATRIRNLVKKSSFEDVAQIAIEAREKMKLRHVPLLLVRELLRNHSGRKVGDLISRVIQRPDELGELLSLYWQDNKNAPLAAQLKIGLARGLKKFNEYQLAKWNKDGAVKLRDVLFLSHAKPDNEAQVELFRKLAQNELTTPDTWEVALSGGADKKQAFERLIAENKLGALALLRNLRGMLEAHVDEDIIRHGLINMSTERVLPFRFISAAKYAPRLEDALEQAMFKCLSDLPKLNGKTALLIDHSGSMQNRISEKSEISRFDAAAALAMILRETAERVRVFTFSDKLFEVAPRRGFALVSAVKEVVNPVGTLLGSAVRTVYQQYPECDRVIVITDEQSQDRPPHPQGSGYIINVAGYQQGIGYGSWVTIDGWSENILEYIREYESES
jgi:60 kDa SS-A/Ro ribonucleoprotein